MAAAMEVAGMPGDGSFVIDVDAMAEDWRARDADGRENGYCESMAVAEHVQGRLRRRREER